MVVIPINKQDLADKIACLTACFSGAMTESVIAALLAEIQIMWKASLGHYGGKTYSDTASHTNLNVWFIIVVADATFTTLTGTIETATGVPYPVGTVLYGQFTGMQLTSGVVTTYDGPSS